MSSCHDTQASPTASSSTARRPVIALAGNPNCGKTTLFNLLTGAHQHVGNWPGVTVERRQGTANLADVRVAVADLPGVYSLLGGGGGDQTIARDFLLDGEISLVVNIIDASNLERHLALTAELMEMGRPMLMVLNMVDEAKARGLEPRVAELSAALGIPVVPLVARTGRGKRELLEALYKALQTPPQPRRVHYAEAVETALRTLSGILDTGSEAERRFTALRLLEGVADAASPALGERVDLLNEQVMAAEGEAAADLLAGARYGWAHDLATNVMHHNGHVGMRQRVTDILDHIALHDWLGVPVFLFVLYLVFVVSFSGGNIFLDFFNQVSSALLIGGVGHVLYMLGLPMWLVSIIAGGIGGGLNLVITFIPPIGLTFLFLALLDDSGYMARAAYAMDRLMRRLGLPGNALVPMVIGFGCNVPAIMGSRIIEDPRGRILTVLMQPFMSCSARLTIYMAFAVVFFRSNGGQVVFLLYILGIMVALLTAWLLGKTAVRGKALPFVMELPPYRLPSVQSVLVQSWQRLKVFLFRVGRVIAVIGLVLFILPGIGWTNNGIQTTDIDHSLLAQGSRALVPLFEPMGIQNDNWPAVSGLVAGAAAKEIVIGTLNGIYQRQSAADLVQTYRDPDIGALLQAAVKTIPANALTFVMTLDDPLGLSSLNSTRAAEQASGADSATLKAIALGFTPLSAFAYLVFVLLYVPCASTMGALRREVGLGWMMFSTLYGVGLAWGAATIIYQVGTFALHPVSSSFWIGSVVTAFILLVLGLRRYGSMRQQTFWPLLDSST
jgi:ferrous iron transport protein B